MRKFSVGLVVLRKARVSKSKQTDGGYLILSKTGSTIHLHFYSDKSSEIKKNEKILIIYLGLKTKVRIFWMLTEPILIFGHR